MAKLCIDIHEDPKDINKVREMALAAGFEVEIAEYQVSDYYVGKTLGIEHKKPADFILSLKSHRLFQQATELKENFTIPIIMVDGDLNNMAYAQVFSHMNPASILAAVDSLYINYGVPVYFVGKSNLAHRIIGLAQKTVDGGSSVSYTPIRPNASIADYQIHVLLAFPGIGRKKADAILKEYGTLNAALNRVDDWENTVKGIGPSIVKKVKDILEKQDTKTIEA